jgi:hypothetical protein
MMLVRQRIFVLISAAIWFVAPERAGAQRWAFLGERKVGDAVDHDRIPVTSARGDFRAIKLMVRAAPIRFYRVVVTYGNGAPDEIELRSLIPAGGETRVMDLRRGQRVIKHVDFWYEAKSLGRKQALIRLLARN